MNEEKWILYQTENICNGKIYVGVHKVEDTPRSRSYLGSGDAIKAAIKKYGRENFTIQTLAEFSSAKEAYTAEAVVVTPDFLNRPDTYNICLGGRGGASRLPEIRAKISNSLTGKTHSDETKVRMSASQKGKKLTEEHKAKIGISQKGRKHTDESKKKMSSASKGMVFTKEHRKKLSISAKANITDERQANLREILGLAVVINGKYYPSATFASATEKVRPATVLSRARSEKPKFADYRFATPEEKAAHSLEASRQST
jgi:group I intron endonuclease